MITAETAAVAGRRRRVWAAVALAVALTVAVGCTGPPTTRSLDQRIDGFFDLGYTDEFGNVRAVLVTAHGKRLVERYYGGSAAAPGNVYSITKSVVSTLVGIALDEGQLRSVDQTLAELLPSYTDVMAADVRTITLYQLLTMTAGLHPSPPGELPPFVAAGDWVAAILADARHLYDPVPSFTYADAESHLLSAILAEATGEPVLDYARQKLFTPLGIDSEPAAEPVGWSADARGGGFAWPKDRQGRHLGFAGLRLTARDLAKLGQLWLDQGRWNGRQLVSAAWVSESTQSQVSVDDASGYGYQWWVTTADGHPAFATLGAGGQLLEVVPELGLVVVVSSTKGLGNPGAELFLELVSSYIAPGISL